MGVLKSAGQFVNKYKVPIILVVGTYVAYRVYKKVKADDDLAKTRSDLKELESKGDVPQYMSSQYVVWANALKQAFAGAGTTNDVVFNVFSQMKTTADVLKLYDAFGIWQEPCDPVQFPISWMLGKESCGSGDLAMAIASEMSTAEIKKLNDLLKGKGIKYSF
jgi:hypothetical protein